MTDLLADGERWRIDQGECLEWLAGLPADCADLVITSPPYVDARLYLEAGVDLGISRATEEWVAWMAGVVRACLRVCKGLVAVVCEGKQTDWRYDAAPFLLLADLAREGICPRKPAVFHRVGIPGKSDAWRNDWEPVLLFTRGGRLPWSNPTACGKPPKYPAGGEPSYRERNGERVNARRTLSRRRTETDRVEPSAYTEPAIANPGNVIHCTVGGGHMGHRLASENEAPYPADLVYPFVVSFCPPGGLVLDPFGGSGTTVAVAVETGRRGLGCDLRPSQVELGRRRVSEANPPLPGMEP